VPFSWIPGEAFDKVDFKYREEKRFGEHREVSGHFERGPMFFLGKDSNQLIALG
jgi:hypothetical protein